MSIVVRKKAGSAAEQGAQTKDASSKTGTKRINKRIGVLPEG
ncbi:MAG: hypothetical protein ACK54F_03860 [Planctomycetia bacterium]